MDEALQTEKSLAIYDRQVEEFSSTLAFQTQLLEAKVADRSLPDSLIFVEHLPVYTVGRGVSSQVVSRYPDVPWREIGRGGQATFHGPGQLVAYPIFDLTRHGQDVHVFLRNLEECLIRTVAAFGVTGFRREGLTGIWVRDSAGALKKIASIGIGVRRWVSFHGVALNLSTELEYFREISACGQDGECVTSLVELSRSLPPENRKSITIPSMNELKQELAKNFQEVFGFGAEKEQVALPRPNWLKVRAPGSPEFRETYDVVRRLKLVTVCEEARCPNMGECWSHHTATFMIMGDLCTRRCSFCSVKDGILETLSPLDPLEPVRVANAVKHLGLEHVVITSVNRDDLEDMGAAHFDQTVRALARVAPACRIELLIPDMAGRRELVETVLRSGLVSVLNHNIETVPRLYRTVRPGANLKRSLNVLRWAKELHPTIKPKSGVMVGLGETREEVLEVMDYLREAGCEILTVGQYLQPTPKQLSVHRFVTPQEFEDYRAEGEKRGFSHVESGPLVRSSYHAWKHVNDAKDSNVSVVQRPHLQEGRESL